MATLPPSTPNPCDECPWRRDAARGWLGPFDPDEWLQLAHSDEPIACHKTIKHVNADGVGAWDDPAIRQCQGSAIFRANVCKSPRNPDVADNDGKQDKITVFARNDEFREHHDIENGMRSWERA